MPHHEGKPPSFYASRATRNAHDANAVRVMVERWRCVGYLYATDAERIAPRLDAGQCIAARIVAFDTRRYDDAPDHPIGVKVRLLPETTQH